MLHFLHPLWQPRTNVFSLSFGAFFVEIGSDILSAPVKRCTAMIWTNAKDIALKDRIFIWMMMMTMKKKNKRCKEKLRFLYFKNENGNFMFKCNIFRRCLVCACSMCAYVWACIVDFFFFLFFGYEWISKVMEAVLGVNIYHILVQSEYSMVCFQTNLHICLTIAPTK